MDYSKAEQWILGEKAFDSSSLGKCEAVMCLGNGYMGMRSATEERYLHEKRNFFIAGTFNQFDENEVTELPNAADLIGMEFKVNGHRFDLEKGEVREYYRQLNLKTGELTRTVYWVSPAGDEVEVEFKRIVSMHRLHILAQMVTWKPLNCDIELEVTAGIDGQLTNSGSQHFSEGQKRLYDKTFMQYLAKTSETGIDFVFNTGLKFYNGADKPEVQSKIIMERRQILSEYKLKAAQGKTSTIEKISNAHTSRDKEKEGMTLDMIREIALDDVKKAYELGYKYLAAESAEEWENLVWNTTPVHITTKESRDQLAVRFAQYHLYVMTPRHDNRMHVGAKGLSGEGYKGHTFWDTDIFVLPYFTYTAPDIARTLEEYRYLSLPGAHEKAKENGYEGAMFPWESAWLDDGEVTPVWGAADIITGLPTKIWSGFKEQHISSDVVYGVWQYYMMTGDQEFMDSCGYELMLDTAKFWSSRLEWDESDQMYHINDVVGPDEYKERIDDNAFTNYMAHWNIRKAMEYYRELKSDKSEIFDRLNEKLDLDHAYTQWQERLDKIYLPQPREEDLVLPQNKTYLGLDEIDLTKYKNQEKIGSLFDDYNLEQVNQMQITKQADVMILFFLMEDMFSLDVKKANWEYYEPRTLHDSSLSLSTHSVLASDMGEKELAYSLFRRACNIDMGENMKSSDPGIHAASIAGIWQSAVYGFGGVRMLNGELRINPNLPDAWEAFEFTLMWKGQKLQVRVDQQSLSVENMSKESAVEIELLGNKYTILDKQIIKL